MTINELVFPPFEEVEELLQFAKAHVHLRLGSLNRDFLFVHAGVVQIGESVVLFPGRSMAGKSTLIKALVDVGARYLSDEFAVIDQAGLVHAFPRELALREPEPHTVPLERLGWVALTPPLPAPVSAIYHLSYKTDARWHVSPVTRGEAILFLFENAIAAQGLGNSGLQWLDVATRGASAFRGVRGEAVGAAARILSICRGC